MSEVEEELEKTETRIRDGLFALSDCLVNEMLNDEPCKVMEDFRKRGLSDSEIINEVMSYAVLGIPLVKRSKK